MRKLILFGVSLFLLTCAVQSVKAQASGNGTANAKILAPIAINEVNNLDFGSIAAGSVESTIKITPSGTNGASRSLETGDATLYTTSDAGDQGTFTVTGAANHTFSITLPTNPIPLSAQGSSGGADMNVGSFTSDPSGTGTLDGSGSLTINIGATLTIGPAQAADTYSGSYSVTVNYN